MLVSKLALFIISYSGYKSGSVSALLVPLLFGYSYEELLIQLEVGVLIIASYPRTMFCCFSLLSTRMNHYFSAFMKGLHQAIALIHQCIIVYSMLHIFVPLEQLQSISGNVRRWIHETCQPSINIATWLFIRYIEQQVASCLNMLQPILCLKT